jgi:NitT/TauT family transport system ATP-binding protein
VGAGVVFVTHSLAEAVFLSDRVVVMSPRPGTSVATIKISLPRPRLPEIEDDPAFFALESNVRSKLLAGAGR